LQGKGGDDAVTDYIMSKMFGLDWIEYPAERVNLLMVVHSEKIKIEEKEVKKAERKNKSNRMK